MSIPAILILAGLVMLIFGAGLSTVMPDKAPRKSVKRLSPAFSLIVIGLAAGLQTGAGPVFNALHWLSPFAIGMGLALLLANLRANKAAPSGGTSE